MSHDKSHQEKQAPGKECSKDHVHGKECQGKQKTSAACDKGTDSGTEHQKKHGH